MSFARYIRRAIPLRWQPAARYHYERIRGLTEREMAVVCNAVRPGDRVADIGASHGVYTYALARRGALVEAFEPQAECVSVLAAFAAATPSVHVHDVALGASAAAARLVSVGAGHSPETRVEVGGDASDTRRVKVVSLDELQGGPFTMLKIDVEGSETAVLRGAVQTIARDRPLIFVEVEQRHLADPIGRVFKYIESLGYVIEFLDATGRPRPVRDFDVQRDQDVEAIGRPGHVYVNNFFLSHAAGERRWFPAGPGPYGR